MNITFHGFRSASKSSLAQLCSVQSASTLNSCLKLGAKSRNGQFTILVVLSYDIIVENAVAMVRYDPLAGLKVQLPRSAPASHTNPFHSSFHSACADSPAFELALPAAFNKFSIPVLSKNLVGARGVLRDPDKLTQTL